MHRLNTLFQLLNAASSVRDMARESKTYHFAVNGPITFYLRAEQTLVEVARWNRPMIEVAVQLQVPLGWRIGTDQDEAGVYIALARRSVVGGLSSAVVSVHLPVDAHLMLKLENSSVRLSNINGTLEIPATQPGGIIEIQGENDNDL
jgi:hypothetical protein